MITRAFLVLMLTAAGIAGCGGGGGGGADSGVTASADVTSGPYPLTVTFSANASQGTDAASLSYRWDFGDSTPDKTGQRVRHVFAAAGTYEVSVTLEDGQGALATDTLTITTRDDAPPEFTVLYEELSAALLAWERSIDANWDGSANPDTFFATNLLPSSAHGGPALLDPTFQAGNLLFLDALKALGFEGVTIELAYPILTPAFHAEPADAQAYLDFYVDVANEVRARGMQVLIKHNVLLPGYSALPVSSYYGQLTPQRFGTERYLETLAIMENIAPDYLTIVGETSTWGEALGLTITLDDWVAYVEGTLDQLAIDIGPYQTLIGAGGGTWETTGPITRFAAIPELDYIDLHVYPVASFAEDYLENALTWPDLIRAIDPSKRIVMGESWLYKASAGELGAGVTNDEIFARDVFGFWGPLDQKFHEGLVKLAHSKDFDFIAPFWARYYLAYLNYGDPALVGLSSFELLDEANQAASEALQNGEFSATGLAYRDFIVHGVEPVND